MRSLIVCFSLAFLMAAAPGFSAAADEDEFSRQQLYFSMILQDQGAVQYSLPGKFKFPETLRKGSSFGIDVSHYTKDQCNCNIDWNELRNDGVDFVYAKATQGTSYKDPTFDSYRSDILSSVGKISFGAYHFLTAADDPSEQAEYFLKVIGEPYSKDITPSLDLEWNAGPIVQNCPANAVIVIKKANGSIIQRCDKWSGFTGDQIIRKANEWIDRVTKVSGSKPVIYTNAAWWNARVGDGERISELHSDLIWIADYSRSGLATEVPAVPGKRPWKIWQFTEGAEIVVNSKTLFVDASIAAPKP
ncbi:glycoside hydrolase family 25 protein [Rhizobium sp. LEGMi135b]